MPTRSVRYALKIRLFGTFTNAGCISGAFAVVFRFRPKRKGVVFLQATKRNSLMGTAHVRVR
jgi:hypothetical protein